MGIIGYVALNLITGKAKEKSKCSDVCTCCTFILKYIFL